MDEHELLHEPDTALCQLARLGVSEAEEILVKRYARTVRICARPLFLSGGDGEDLIQEGMLGLLSAVRSFQEEQGSTFHTYAEVCIKNRLRTAIRAANRGKHSPLNQAISFETPLFDTASDALLPLELSPEDMIISREAMQERLDSLKNQMSGFESEVLSPYLEGYTCNEIAHQLGKSSKSVDNAIQRIRKKLERHH